MYRHILAVMDCTEESRRTAARIAEHFGPLTCCKVTALATFSPAPTASLREKRVKHAEEALDSVARILKNYGIYAYRRILENADPVEAIYQETHREDPVYDLVVLGTHQTRVEDMESPCQGSFADRLSQRLDIPVLILPH